MIETPLYMQEGAYSARQDRLVFDVLFTEGVIDMGGDEWLVTERAAGPNMSVDVAPGRAVIDGDDQANQGAYFVRSTGVENVVVAPADLVNPRIDLVVLRVRDSNVIGGANDDAIVDVIEGVPAAVPAAPALPASAIPLASILVPVGMVDVEDADVTDLRAPSSTREFTVTSGWETLTTAERDALVPFDGQAIYNTDDGQVQTWSELLDEWIPAAHSSGIAALDSIFATTTFVNTAAEQSLYVKALPVDFVAGETLRLRAAGSFLNSSGASVNYTVRLKLGTTTIFATSAIAVSTSANRRRWTVDALIVVEAAAAQRISALLAMTANSADTWGLPESNFPRLGEGAATENLAVAKTLALTVQMGTAHASAESRITHALLERITP